MASVHHLPSPAERRPIAAPRLRPISLIFGVALAASGCASESAITAATPDAVEVTATASSMQVGGSQQLTARVTSRGQLVTAITPSWSSSDGAVVSVTATGQVTALSRGSATVTATAGAARGSVTLTVLGVRTIALQPATLALPIGSSQPLTATIDADAGITAPTVTWSSGNPTVAAVSATGVATALAVGTATITATSQGKSASATVAVVLPVTVSSVLVAPQTATLAVGGTQQLTATARDSAGNALTGRPVIWSSANLTVATVSATGLVTGVGAGTTNVTATVDGRSAAANLMIQGPVTSLAVSPATATVALGGTQAFIAIAKDAIGQALTGRTVTWSSSDPIVASVSNLGVVTGLVPGSTTIAATVEGQRATALLSVENRISPRASGKAGGFNHSCALATGGEIYCWGSNSDGQLGRPGISSSSVPLAVAGGRQFTMASIGQFHSCGLTSSGSAFCWGNNGSGQVGDGTTTSRNSPTAVGGSLSFATLTTGGYHSCGLTSAGSAYCWGNNPNGQLGNGGTANISIPVPVSGTLELSLISAGFTHTCGLTRQGVAYCWGNNDGGQLGIGGTTNSTIPRAVSGSQRFVALSAGGSHTCGMTPAGTVYCWGDNRAGQLGGRTPDEYVAYLQDQLHAVHS